MSGGAVGGGVGGRIGGGGGDVRPADERGRTGAADAGGDSAVGGASSAARPRRLGLLTDVDGAGPLREADDRFPYSPGARIAGDLTVIGHLSPGRHGHLYQVWSARSWCALTCKIAAPERLGEREAIASFRKEARILRRLDHPNVVRFFGAGEHEGLPFLLMEYLEGPSVFDILECRPRRRLDVADAVRVAIHIGAGLFHLHRRGYLHLDVKPANLLLRDAVPVLVDFDVARPIRPARRPRRSLGTAPYMAPEQVRQEPQTAATDVYGLGAVLYEMVTGRWPYEDVFTGKDRRRGEERYFPQIGERPPPSTREFNGGIPPSLDRTILRCLAHAPEDRFASLHPLLLRLTAALDEPTALWPAGVQAERRRRPRPA
ncbi:MAG: serine/threonine-protein kinase [Gemmatimonadota bacterium]